MKWRKRDIWHPASASIIVTTSSIAGYRLPSDILFVFQVFELSMRMFLLREAINKKKRNFVNKIHLTPIPVCTSISLTAYGRLSETETLLTRVVITIGFWVVIYFGFGVVIFIPSVVSFFNQQNPDISKRLCQRYWYTIYTIYCWNLWRIHFLKGFFIVLF